MKIPILIDIDPPSAERCADDDGVCSHLMPDEASACYCAIFGDDMAPREYVRLAECIVATERAAAIPESVQAHRDRVATDPVIAICEDRARMAQGGEG